MARRRSARGFGASALVYAVALLLGAIVLGAVAGVGPFADLAKGGGRGGAAGSGEPPGEARDRPSDEPSGKPEAGPSGKPPEGLGTPATARERLRALEVTATGDSAGYDRDRFGQQWADVDRNGCDTRNDILARDLDDVTRRGRCVVVGGVLDDPYTGRRITFVKADAGEVQIDHVYPLGLAWRMGASGWPAERRERFANDRDNLLATDGTTNQEKSDSGPGEWRPRRGYWCAYAVRYVAVAHEYDLAVSPADRVALEAMLASC